MSIGGNKWRGIIKLRFRSRSEHNLDPKGRLNFPSRFKEVLRQYEYDVLMVTIWGQYLRAFPVSEWTKFEEQLHERGKQEPGFTRLLRYIIAGVVECRLDKQGRILLPASMRSEISLQKDVVITGMLDWVEIWAKETWDAEHKETKENFGDFEASLARMGIL